ncbi:MAG: hypothetical protein QNI90_08585 [Dinoroseobacter sp.]|nr:hypothetical protein [Dinoroseobacter sp.]
MSGDRLFDTHVVVDWSARNAPSPVKPTKDAIFWAVVRDGAKPRVYYARTRAAARTRLTSLLRKEQDAGRRLLIGFDFPFGYPRGVAQTLTGQDDALALWDWIDAEVQDASNNTNNRFDVACRINRHFPGDGPMWGHPAGRRYQGLGPTKPTPQDGHPPERRFCDARASGAKTVWQLAYAGAVGSQVLLGLPLLKTLRETTGASVWPFDTGLTAPHNAPVLAEVYPSLLQAQAHADRGEGEPLDAAQVRVSARALAALDRQGELAPLFAPELPAAEHKIVATEEAWILGLGFEDTLRAAA